MMEKSAWVVVAALLLTLFFQPPSVPAAEAFTDPAGYRLDVPRGWRIEDRTGRDELIRADLVKSDRAGVQVRLMDCPAGGFDRVVEAAIESYQGDMARHWGGAVDEVGREMFSAGDQALTVRFRAERQHGGTWYLQESFIRLDDRLVVLQGGCLWDERKGFSDAMDRMAHSVRPAY
jgi:hypothetical protein